MVEFNASFGQLCSWFQLFQLMFQLIIIGQDHLLGYNYILSFLEVLSYIGFYRCFLEGSFIILYISI